MNISGQRDLITETATFRKEDYAVLCGLSADCLLTRTDRRRLVEHIQRADRIGTGGHVMLARLLSQKLLHAAVVEDDKIGASIAAGGTRVTYAIDGRQAQAGRLRHDDGPAPGENGVHVATLLGATLIGMKAGARAPFLQADGSFRSVSLLAVTR